MDYKKNISLMIKGLLLLLLLSACSDEVNTGSKIEPDSLSVIGFDKVVVYYDTLTSIPFGASGGDGVHRYRYIQNPENPDDRDSDFIFNPVELTVQKIDGPKPSFILSGVHRTEDGVNIEDLPTGVFSYQIEITDGKSVKLETFELELKINKFNFQTGELLATESFADNSKADTLRNAKRIGNTTICDEVENNSYEKKTLANGVTVYPLVMNVGLDVPMLERVEYFYRFTSIYNDEFPERHKSNIGSARANVDFLAESRSVVFEPGKSNCLIYLNVLDDAIYEGNEVLRLELYDFEGALTEINVSTVDVTIRENEPLPIYRSKSLVRNEGEKIISTISLSRTHTLPITFNFSADMTKTTASADDYLLTPESGVITIEPGEFEASFTVSLLNNDDDANVADDDVISIVTDIDEILDIEPLTITINEWPSVSENEIVASASLNQKALGLNVSSQGLTSILLQSMSVFNEEQTVVFAKNHDGSDLRLSNTPSGALVLGKQGIRVKPVAIGSYVSITDDIINSYLAVVSNVDGLYSNTHRGSGDFIVAVYRRDYDENSSTFGFYTQESVNQYGSEGHDVANGASFDSKGNIFVFGQTDGLEFDGVSGSEENHGGVNGERLDGFVYSIDITTNTLKLWDSPRFIGTDENDGVVALDVGRSELILLTEKENIDTDLFIKKLTSASGVDVKNIETMNISSLDLDVGTSIAFDRNDNSFVALVDSNFSLSDGSPTQSFSRDINIVSFSADGTQGRIKNISTNQDDFSVVIENITNSDMAIIGGYTLGELEGNQSKGATGTDAFISTFFYDDDEGLPTFVQFGTEGDDKVIDVKSVSENKFLVLWSENHTDENDLLTYRVSAFSSEGEMLSKEP